MVDYIVEFSNVTKIYRRQVALKNVSFSLPRGKIIALVGPNGSGKSTILKLISGLAYPNRGSVTINGKKANRRNAGEIAYLSELDVFYPFFTVDETIQFNAGLFDDFDAQKAGEILRFMQLEPGMKVKNLSKGNRGRLKILLALSRGAPLILLDEPLSGLDPIVRETIVKSMISYIDLEKQTVIMSTHEVSEAEPILDIVVAIWDGQIRGVEEVENIREQYGLNLVEWMKAR